MDFKTCKILNDNFKLDEKYNVILANSKNFVKVTNGLEKGYIYAAMYFYDEVSKETAKLERIVRKNLDLVNLEGKIEDVPILLLDLSKRVYDAIGDDSLDFLIKQILGENHKHIALTPEKSEIAKFEKLQENIFTEIIANLNETLIINSEEVGEHRTITLSENYANKLTERQRKLISPAVKMVGNLNYTGLEDFEREELVMRFKPYRLSVSFTEKEETIKKNLKKLVEENL